MATSVIEEKLVHLSELFILNNCIAVFVNVSTMFKYCDELCQNTGEFCFIATIHL